MLPLLINVPMEPALTISVLPPLMIPVLDNVPMVPPEE